VPSIPRTDVVGSLLRPEYLLEARQGRREGRLTEEDLRSAEDRAVLEAIELQEDSGIEAITDGEYRRGSWIVTSDMSDTGALSGFSMVETNPGWLGLWRNPDGSPLRGEISLEGEPLRRSVVTGKVELRRDVPAYEFPFLTEHATRSRPKFTFPAPSWHRIDWHRDYSRDVYPTMEDLLVDTRNAVRKVIERLVELGCDYIQMDAPNYAQWHTDPEVRGAFEAGGHDMDREFESDIEVDNSVFDSITGVTRAIHVCRGNAPNGRYFSRVGYEPIAERLFPRLTNYDRLLLEYDSERAGDFAPLRHVRPEATVVLGLVSTKLHEVEDAAVIEARVKEATQYVPLERLAISPQCGFASGAPARTTSMEEQAAKLKVLGQVGQKLWTNG
jgi:methionine synthase II (cobalamin-independent)